MLDELDRAAWFKLFLDVEQRFGWKVHAWNLLDNHFHLLVETTQPDLSRGMQRLNGIYAMRFNRRYARSGHLFQGRFESRVIDGDAHLATAVAYIFENTTRVGVRGWPWRGIGAPRGIGGRPLTATPRDYACPRHDGRVETERTPRPRSRPQERSHRDPPHRRARPLQRTPGARGASRTLLGAAGTPRRRPWGRRLRRLDRAGCSDRSTHEARGPRAFLLAAPVSRPIERFRSRVSTSTLRCTTQSTPHSPPS